MDSALSETIGSKRCNGRRRSKTAPPTAAARRCTPRNVASVAMPGAHGALHDLLGLEGTFGSQHTLHRRRRAADDRWESCTAADQGHQPDSGLHRYARVVGFSVGDEERRILANDPLARAAEEEARNRERFQSHLEMIYRWSLFERYLLEHHAAPTTPAPSGACARSAPPRMSSSTGTSPTSNSCRRRLCCCSPTPRCSGRGLAMFGAQRKGTYIKLLVLVVELELVVGFLNAVANFVKLHLASNVRHSQASEGEQL